MVAFLLSRKNEAAEAPFRLLIDGSVVLGQFPMGIWRARGATAFYVFRRVQFYPSPFLASTIKPKSKMHRGILQIHFVISPETGIDLAI